MCGERSAETRLGKPPIPKGPVREPAHWPRWLVVTFLAWAWIGAAASGEDASKKSPASTGGPKMPAISGRSIYANPEGKARVTLFGLTGEGYKFAYVLDRSASMGGSGRAGPESR